LAARVAVADPDALPVLVRARKARDLLVRDDLPAALLPALEVLCDVGRLQVRGRHVPEVLTEAAPNVADVIRLRSRRELVHALREKLGQQVVDRAGRAAEEAAERLVHRRLAIRYAAQHLRAALPVLSPAQVVVVGAVADKDSIKCHPSSVRRFSSWHGLAAPP